MLNIKVLFSAHRENGKCNSYELFRILEQLHPEVIFEEISPSRFNLYYVDRTIETLESIAVDKYANMYGAEHIAVDSDDIPEIEFKKEVDYMFNRIADHNSEYTQLSVYQYSLAGQLGFDYLNGIQFSEISQRILQIEKRAIEEIESIELRHIYNRWITLNRNREKLIVENVAKHCSNGDFKETVLLIGAEHRKGILSMAKSLQGSDQLNWITYKPYE